MFPVLNNKGFGLAEMLVTGGVLAVISLVIITMIDNTTKSQRGLQAKSEQLELTNQIKSLMSNKVACTNTLAGQNPASSYTVTSIKNDANVIKFNVGQNDPSGFLKFEEFRVENWEADTTIPNKGRAKLKVAVSKVGATNSVVQMNQKIGLSIKTDAAGNLIECYAVGNDSDQHWQVSSVNADDIFYETGNVGIGTDNPLVKLDVNGGIRPGSSGINIGNACPAEGTFAYDQTAQSPVYCNNAGLWASFIAQPQAKAWINFNGVGTASIRSSFNVSNVVRNSEGDYTINFSTPMTNANYAAVISTSATNSPSDSANDVRIDSQTTTSMRFRVGGTNASNYYVAYYDAPIINVVIFGQ